MSENNDLSNIDKLHLAFNIHFDNLVKFLNSIETSILLKQHCFMNLDQAAMWARQMIFHNEVKPNIENEENEIKS